ncbi:hypothetical protein Pla52o_23170 [Novipirellula galeiformis]|uniref:Carboxypeptidase regulatory-like domain-containing protein n=1 Tax=Novipirellula galeiformis TaxID=2528004 RepID=A0A5C6CIG5_9BACT|nr:carboxypeptidase-like regulatory domain-containing protein [Novipirellula galeiformis]TWU24390.1 hypothetical protein Pla52o_23170 [Novipirellula galeiformis]
MQFRSIQMLMVPAILASLSLGLAGCTPSNEMATVPVTGKVTYKGQPLPSGSVIFIASGAGPTADANIGPDGEYSLGTYSESDGVPPGEYNVMVVAMTGEDSIDAEAATGSTSLIPSRYSDPSKSGLTASVKAGEDNEINFDLAE